MTGYVDELPDHELAGSRVLTLKEALIAGWGFAGVAALVSRGVLALAPVALEPICSGELRWWHWVVLSAWVGVNAYAEGYAGFHRKFSPRVVSRAFFLGRHPSPLRILLAAPYCMGLFQASRRTLVTSWTLLLGIVALVVGVRHLAQPWRGIIDAGVVVGLALGLASLSFLFVRALSSRLHPRDA